LHLNLTENANTPLTASVKTWIVRTFLRRSPDLAAIKQEIARQLDKFESLFGRRPDYVDGHEHVHQFPIVRDALLAVLSARYGNSIAVRSTVPTTSRGAKAAVIAMLGGRALRKQLLRAGIPTNSDFAGVYDFSTRVPFEALMRGWLASIADGGIVMCHPELSSRNELDARAVEHEFLASERWPQLQREFAVTLECVKRLPN
jgi:predicted glycoside hydrolase/deacetylase ChbG (UPF0249 family)